MAVQPPAGASRNWNVNTLRVAEEIENFGVNCSTYPSHGRPGEAWSIDCWVAPFRSKANKEQEALGDRIQKHVEANWNRLGVDYMIWWNWMKESKDTPWFSYEPLAFQWPHGDPDPDTRRHLDHVHISCRPGFVYQPPKEDGVEPVQLVEDGVDGSDADKALIEVIDAYYANLTDDWAYEPIALVVMEEARTAGLRLALACALVEQESWGRNIFGCDWGPKWTTAPPYCQVEVTERRVKKLIANFESGGGQNGVGLTQLTSRDFVYRAEKLGGAHIPRNQCRVGFSLLKSLIEDYGYEGGIGAYNAGPGNRWGVRWTYTQSVIQKDKAWVSRFNAVR